MKTEERDKIFRFDDIYRVDKILLSLLSVGPDVLIRPYIFIGQAAVLSIGLGKS